MATERDGDKGPTGNSGKPKAGRSPMSSKAIRWEMTSPGAPLAAVEFAPAAGPGEVVVQVAGCGVCHTDLGYYYGGVSTNHPLPLCLGHEISGRVIAAGSGAESWIGATVIVPAVIPCGTCSACRRGKSTICANQKMPGNDIHGGFATHVVVPARGLCRVDTVELAKAGLELADVAVVADAVTTPYQAVTQAGVGPGDLVIVNGVGGVGGYCAQIARAFGATIVAIDVSDEKLKCARRRARGADAQCTPNRSTRAAERHPGLRTRAGAPGEIRVAHLRMLGHARRAGNGIQSAQSWRDAWRRRLHHG